MRKISSRIGIGGGIATIRMAGDTSPR
jgi:hypothetical protein